MCFRLDETFWLFLLFPPSPVKSRCYPPWGNVTHPPPALHSDGSSEVPFWAKHRCKPGRPYGVLYMLPLPTLRPPTSTPWHHLIMWLRDMVGARPSRVSVHFFLSLFNCSFCFYVVKADRNTRQNCHWCRVWQKFYRLVFFPILIVDSTCEAWERQQWYLPIGSCVLGAYGSNGGQCLGLKWFSSNMGVFWPWMMLLLVMSHQLSKSASDPK